jgi:hypothetical protein
MSPKLQKNTGGQGYTHTIVVSTIDYWKHTIEVTSVENTTITGVFT